MELTDILEPFDLDDGGTLLIIPAGTRVRIIEFEGEEPRDLMVGRTGTVQDWENDDPLIFHVQLDEPLITDGWNTHTAFCWQSELELLQATTPSPLHAAWAAT